MISIGALLLLRRYHSHYPVVAVERCAAAVAV